MFSPHFRAAGLTLAAALFFMCPPNRAIAQDANRDTVYTKTDVGDLVQRVAKRSGDFKSAFNRAVEHTMDGTKLEERAKHRADEVGAHGLHQLIVGRLGDEERLEDRGVVDQDVNAGMTLDDRGEGGPDRIG